MNKILRLVAFLAFACACAVRIAPPQAAPSAGASPQKAWADHLSRFVDDKGRMDFRGMAKDPASLNAYLAWAARVGPESDPPSFSTPASKLAYDINTYNAVAMYDVLKSDFPANLDKVKVTFFYKNRFEIGGRSLSLYELENKVVRPMGDPRVHVALNCMARGCPRLPREAFEADKLDQQLDRQAREFYNEERNVRLEPDKQTVHLSQILQFYTGDFTQKAPSLIAYVNQYRDDKIPADWKVEFIPYDWTLNAQ